MHAKTHTHFAQKQRENTNTHRHPLHGVVSVESFLSGRLSHPFGMLRASIFSFLSLALSLSPFFPFFSLRFSHSPVLPWGYVGSHSFVRTEKQRDGTGNARKGGKKNTLSGKRERTGAVLVNVPQ